VKVLLSRNGRCLIVIVVRIVSCSIIKAVQEIVGVIGLNKAKNFEKFIICIGDYTAVTFKERHFMNI
jgi:hypothetical protein